MVTLNHLFIQMNGGNDLECNKPPIGDLVNCALVSHSNRLQCGSEKVIRETVDSAFIYTQRTIESTAF